MKRADIERLLPANIREAIEPASPLDAVLDVMAQLHAPDDVVVAGVDRYFNSRGAPERFVPYLARWVDLGPLLDRLAEELGAGREFPTGTGRLRELVTAASLFSRWRGTRKGMIAFLETASGVTGFVIEEQPGGRPFHIRVVAPQSTASQEPLIRSIVELEKPAHTTYELAFTG